MGCSQLMALLLERILQHHSGDDLHHLLQGDIIGIPGEKTVHQTKCAKKSLQKKKGRRHFSLLERVDLQHEVVTADVFLQTSLQSPQHLHVEHYRTNNISHKGGQTVLICTFNLFESTGESQGLWPMLHHTTRWQ